MSEAVLTIDGIDPLELYGENNVKINLLKKAYQDVQITSRGNQIKLKGDKKSMEEVKSKLEIMVRMIEQKKEFSTQVVEDILASDHAHDNKISPHSSGGVIVYGKNGAPIKAKTKNQKMLVECSEENDIVFAIGPAGTGKTYTAVALAIRALKAKLVKKIILTRPAVEAGEHLGFLPGDMKDKVDPYLRPLYDALDDMIPAEKLNFFITNRVIEVAPLAFMRGRTLDHAFIILDEAQNCTTTQLKMFLTRIGPNAKAIITGDLSQIDLPGYQKSGLRKALDILKPIDGIGQLFLTAEDVVRHRLVKEIIRSYDMADEAEEAERIRQRELREAEKEANKENNQQDNTKTD
ncbi:MAG: PhoH family protein [Bacteroidetes bacterium OLB9]|nr:MAG: PhoH family protein [Bacteroidetes bacterium OLB9]MCZ2338412.1 PhoH family protein [Chitinophagales bacterium]